MSISSRRIAFRPHSALLCGLSLFVAGCGAEDVVTPNPPVPVAETPSVAESAETEPISTATEPGESYQTKVSGFTFTVPAGWREIPLDQSQQGFIDARFEIPDAGEDVSLTLSTVGGGVDANVQRWIGQFTLAEGEGPQIEHLTVDGFDVTWVELQGTFSGMRGPFAGGTPRPDWMMVGVAFAGSPRAPQDFYIKLAGPDEAVQDLRRAFRSFVESARVQ